jgi:hypothetical protein
VSRGRVPRCPESRAPCMARMLELPHPVFQLTNDVCVVCCGMASCAAKAEDRVHESLGRHGSDHASKPRKPVDTLLYFNCSVERGTGTKYNKFPHERGERHSSQAPVQAPNPTSGFRNIGRKRSGFLKNRAIFFFSWFFQHFLP